MMRAALFLGVALLLLPAHNAQRVDKLPDLNRIQDTQLEQFLQKSVKWLDTRALQTNYTVLTDYARHLQQVIVPTCTDCVDYFQAVALVRNLGKSLRTILDDDRNDVHYPVIRRSYVAAVWLLQRSKMFVWETTHLESNAVSTMFRLYLHHVKRAQGRTISFHHISKCGGTTMCQLAATNKCSNPHLTLEKNCVLDDRLDSPVWMVSHDVNEQGAFPNNETGLLDVAPESEIDYAYNRHDYATEPQLSMWLMYACPYQLNGRPYNCHARMLDVEKSGTTFLANERALSRQAGRSEVCPDFLNAITLRQPVPLAISLMAEVKFRYVRQLQKKNITTWEPPGWNLTWWETLGPALVGNYATRSLVGREAFCRSAGNVGERELSQAVDSLLGFDMVMTLERAQDIDLLISNMLAWPARNFSSQPAKRVRDAMPAALTMRRLMEYGVAAAGDMRHSVQAATSGRLHAGSLTGTAAASGTARALLSDTAGDDDDSAEGTIENDEQQEDEEAFGGDDAVEVEEEGWGETDDEEFERAAAQLDGPFEEAPPPPPVPPEVLAAEGAAALVRTSWLERQAQMLGFPNSRAAGRALREPKIVHMQAAGKHGAHELVVTFNGTKEVWHAFPRHAFAFSESHLARLEALTQLDAQLFELADLMLDLDSAWLHSMLQNHHYRQRLKSVAATSTACGFAGVMPMPEAMQKLLRF